MHLAMKFELVFLGEIKNTLIVIQEIFADPLNTSILIESRLFC